MKCLQVVLITLQVLLCLDHWVRLHAGRSEPAGNKYQVLYFYITQGKHYALVENYGLLQLEFHGGSLL